MANTPNTKLLTFTTVKCIPHGCRLAFSQALKIVLCKVVAQPDSVDAWVSSIVKSLATRGKDHGITTLLKSILDGFALRSFVQGGGDFLEERVKGNTNIKQCLRKVADGRHYMKMFGFHGCHERCRSFAMLTMDFLNAFNLMYRSASLHEQDDPLGPILFAFVLHLLVYKIKDSCKLLLNAWYLDDGTVIKDSEEVAKVLDIINVSGPDLGLELNSRPRDIFWPSCNGLKLREGLFHVDIRRPSSGVKLVGGAVSRDADFISGLAMRRERGATMTVDLIKPSSPSTRPCKMSNLLLFVNIWWRLASLPIQFGGFGLYSAKVVSSYVFVASRAQSWVLQDHDLHDSGICGMDDDYVYTLACLRDTIPSFDFSGFTNKDIVPSKAQQTLVSVLFSEMVKDLEAYFDGLSQHMSSVEYHTILKNRLMILLFLVDAICPVCRKAYLDSFGEHAVHCKELPGFKYNTIWLWTSFLTYVCVPDLTKRK
ncbi:hypothetical protein Tco_1049100 [Tanacetum coccineum]